MEKEEKEAMWERISNLEKNQVKFCKSMAYESVLTTYNLVLMIISASEKDTKGYTTYMGDKFKKAEKDIFSMKNVDEIIEFVRRFNYDCGSYMKSVL